MPPTIASRPSCDELAERGFLFRIAFQERLHVAGLIEHEAVVGMGFQQRERPQDVGQPHVEIFLAGLEDRPFPVRVGNEEEGVLGSGWCRVDRLG